MMKWRCRQLRELVQAGCDPILVLGASAIVDRRDVIPSQLSPRAVPCCSLGCRSIRATCCCLGNWIL